MKYSSLAAFFREQSKKVIVRTENALKGIIFFCKGPAVCNETAKGQDTQRLSIIIYIKLTDVN
jgi:hypothetical protein